MYTMEYYSVIKENKINSICSNMDEPRDYHTKWSKPDRERQISYDITYMCNLKRKTYKLTYLQKSETHRHRKQTYGYQVRMHGEE